MMTDYWSVECSVCGEWDPNGTEQDDNWLCRGCLDIEEGEDTLRFKFRNNLIEYLRHDDHKWVAMIGRQDVYLERVTDDPRDGIQVTVEGKILMIVYPDDSFLICKKPPVELAYVNQWLRTQMEREHELNTNWWPDSPWLFLWKDTEWHVKSYQSLPFSGSRLTEFMNKEKGKDNATV